MNKLIAVTFYLLIMHTTVSAQTHITKNGEKCWLVDMTKVSDPLDPEYVAIAIPDSTMKEPEKLFRRVLNSNRIEGILTRLKTKGFKIDILDKDDVKPLPPSPKK